MPNRAPWSADLEQHFQDETVRASVDAYLRENIQPRMTKLETDFAGTEQARQLYDALNGDGAADAYFAVGEALFGEDAAQRLVGALTPEEETAAVTPPATPETPAEPTPLELDALPAEVRAVVEAHQTQQRQAQFQSEVERVKTEHFAEKPDDFMEREFALSVVACEGDVNAAVEHYNERMATLRPAPAEPVVETPVAPPALGTQPGAGGGTADAPVAEKYDSMDAAFNAFFDEAAAPAPTALGTV